VDLRPLQSKKPYRISGTPRPERTGPPTCITGLPDATAEAPVGKDVSGAGEHSLNPPRPKTRAFWRVTAFDKPRRNRFGCALSRGGGPIRRLPPAMSHERQDTQGLRS